MSLFSSLQMANNTLVAQQIGLQVVGQNIANANTPGYSREEVIFKPAPTQRAGGLLLGLGVEVHGIVQVIDRYLEERLRIAGSDAASGDVQNQVYTQLERFLGELGETDISTSLNKFFASIADILNQPDSAAVRNLAVLQGETLAAEIRQLHQRVTNARLDLNDRVVGSATDINRLLKEIRDLNLRITAVEGGSVSASDAVGLRDQRNQTLADLSQLINVRVQEQPSGAVNVFLGGDFLVFEGVYRTVTTKLEPANGVTIANLFIDETDSPLQAGSGEVAGLVAGRDDILGGFLDDLDAFASSLIFEFNKIFSSGQGLVGHNALTGQSIVLDVDAPLDAAGLEFTPNNGGFQLQVFNKQTGLTETHNIAVDLNGLDDDDTTLTSLAAAIDAVAGVSATVNVDKRLVISADSANLSFAFADDTSGALAALGINTFFTGATGRDIGVNAVLTDRETGPAKFAASRSGIGADTANAIDLADFLTRPLDAADGATLEVLYEQLAGKVTQGASVAKAVANGLQTFKETLDGQRLATSGVSLDEEAVKMITYQRVYQAAARFVSTLNELLEILVNL